MNPGNLEARKKSFGAIAKDYQKYRRDYNPKTYRKLFSLINIPKEGKICILDIGSGTGKSTEPLFHCAPKRIANCLEVIGCDHDEAMLDEARSHAKKLKLPITYVEGKAERLPFGNNSFDAVISGTAFHWFANETAFKEIKRVLKPGGLFFVFWKGPTRIMHKGKHVGHDIFQKCQHKSLMKKWHDVETTKRLFTDSGFVHFDRLSFFENQTDTIEQIMGGLKTNSKFIVLPPAERKEVLGELKKRYVEALGKREHFTSKRESVAFWGFIG